MQGRWTVNKTNAEEYAAQSVELIDKMDDFRAWRRAQQMTRAEAGAVLGVSPRSIENYEQGRHAVPESVQRIIQLRARLWDIACMGDNMVVMIQMNGIVAPEDLQLVRDMADGGQYEIDGETTEAMTI